jgi:predicted metal-dependent peptidase
METNFIKLSEEEEKAMQETNGKATAGITMNKGKIYFVYSEEWINSLNESKRMGLAMHEYMHLINLTNERRKNRSRKLWNIATDYAINEEILNTRIAGELVQLPNEGCFMSKLREQDYTGKVLSEEIYDFLMENAEVIEMYQPVDDHSGIDQEEEGEDQQKIQKIIERNEEEQSENSGSGEESNDQESSGDENGSGDSENRQAIEDILERAKEASNSYGSDPANQSILLKEVANSKRVDLRALLRSKIGLYLSSKGAPRYTWKKKNRRGYKLPGKRHALHKVHVFVDASGSCFDKNTLGKFFGEIDHFIKLGFEIELYSFDTQVHKMGQYKVRSWNVNSIPGGGGTDVQDIFDTVQKNGLRNAPIVIFTDGIFNWNINHYNIEPLWILTQNDNYGYGFGRYGVAEGDKVPFGKEFRI